MTYLQKTQAHGAIATLNLVAHTFEALGAYLIASRIKALATEAEAFLSNPRRVTT